MNRVSNGLRVIVGDTGNLTVSPVNFQFAFMEFTLWFR